MFNSKKTRKHLIKLVLIAVLVFIVSSVASAQPGSEIARLRGEMPEGLAANKLDASLSIDGVDMQDLRQGLAASDGPQRVIVQLNEPAVSQVASGIRSRSLQQSQLAAINAQQDNLLRTAKALDSNLQVLGRTQKVLNAVMLQMDAAAVSRLGANRLVKSIHPIADYELDLSETVPYIGATAVQGMGYDGTGVSVAVLDSGVDYYHAHLGGSGDPADYAADDPNVIEPGTFPTAKVVGGYDFTGSNWPNTPEEFDPDPLDDGPAAGHGTSVADIIGGGGGVAPNADIYAVKVCSSVSTSCSGLALILGMDFALDPNGDGFIDDAVDIINMSLGANYGRAFDDDLSQAVENASYLGVLTVTSAGNGSDKPYVLGSPASAPSALAVAQTQVPSAIQGLMAIDSPASVAGNYAAVHQPWSPPLTDLITGPAIYGDGAGGNLNGCAPFSGSLAGYVVLVDRGACNFTLKISNISQAGGMVGIIGLVAPGTPFSGGDGGDRPIDIPGYMISQADSNAVKSGLAEGVTITFDPANGIPLVGHMVGSSSRGPSNRDNLAKPEIGAPGASVAANAGTGTGEGPFGGTSGASPMVAGSAALVLNAFPDRAPHEVKSVLINTAETNIMNSPAFFGGDLAPITRIGGGEVRVDRAIASPAAAWDSQSLSGVISFGFHDVSRKSAFEQRTVTVKNYTDQDLRYRVSSTFRFEDDELNEAVRIRVPRNVFVPANSTTQFVVTMRIKAEDLREWTHNSGSLGASGDSLTTFEYDGYIWLDNIDSMDDDSSPLHLAWQVLPRLSGDVEVDDYMIEIDEELLGLPAAETEVENDGEGTSYVDTFSLIGMSDNAPEGGPGQQMPWPDLRYVGVQTYPVPAGFCGPTDSFVMGFAVNTWERETHAIGVPGYYWIDLDVNDDGTIDYTVLNRDLTLSGIGDGRSVTWVVDWAAGGTASAFFFTDHKSNSANTVLLFCGDQIGMDASDFFVTPIGVDAYAFDFYYGGPGDAITDKVITPLGEQYFSVFDETDFGFTTLEEDEEADAHIIDFGPSFNTEMGVLWLFGPGAPEGNEAAAIFPIPDFDD